MKLLLATGGTGGHIFPAIALADEIKRRNSAHDVLFVGATGGMETELIPKAGYSIKTIEIRGIRRHWNLKSIWENLQLPWVLWKANQKAKEIIGNFQPSVVCGFGGYASYPIVNAAADLHYQTAIAEQNAFPGIANKRLASKVNRIFLGDSAAIRWLPKDKCLTTGNPVRLPNELPDQKTARKLLNLNPNIPTLVILGGSLGATTINQSILRYVSTIQAHSIQVLWQCGKKQFDYYRERVSPLVESIHLLPFIENMSAAYAAADLVICRAGAMTIAELIHTSQPAILVPSPNVAENHQTHNALSLVERNAAKLIHDQEAIEKLIPEAIRLLETPDELAQLKQAIQAIEKPNAVGKMADVIESLAF
ncbi:MAG: undecaprenyldiphospho-muramoylpentapeptide beta-N-acetylglucosaminyltransferase [Bacteroidia bacterium]|nr:undecaprenyldiphospho-muramoylpentapeptide beta-N-acetylglucosaminyltransferase [Bacteroidia bacterium]